MIIKASEDGDTEIIEMLINDPRIDPTYKDNFAIRGALLNGHIDVVNTWLKDTRVDPNLCSRIN
ncbi:hypothetical protein ROZALSC1DRAFT_31525 [Rozella allomycis CSF55]|nr:hypothetical protein O9G_006175 [Rozella allomycis CSF55]RKP16560.1 hypothetical protein ROZALSC1DRAFT_31525 [Rozella allomycis CSF55]|eukprot:EPZ31233.1 hypothetical protein O9G_006175 [Rozella allomycis CSF55]